VRDLHRPYEVRIRPSAEREFRSLPGDVQARLKAALLHLAQDPRPPTAAKLVAAQGWRVRVGDYRVGYEIDDAKRVVMIGAVGHRREFYRRIRR